MECDLTGKILLGSIKLERMLENEAKKLLAEKRKNSRKRK